MSQQAGLQCLNLRWFKILFCQPNEKLSEFGARVSELIEGINVSPDLIGCSRLSDTVGLADFVGNE